MTELLAFLQLAALARPRAGPAVGRPAPARRAGPRAGARSRRSCCSTSRWARSTRSCAAQLQVELKDIQRRTGKTFLFVTHDQEEALTMSDRIVVMNAGRVEQDGTPEELYFHPASRFVAEFIGETNLISGRILGGAGDGSARFDWNGRTLIGRMPPRGSLGEGAAAGASLRLERIRVTAARPDRGTSVEARILGRTFKGSRTELDLAVPGAGDARLRAYADTAHAAGLGDGPVWAGWDDDALALLQD